MSTILLRLKNLTKIYGSDAQATPALSNISLDIYQGEIIGLLGANGAGKTTLSSILATLHPPTSGTVEYLGESIYRQLSQYRSQLGYIPQRPNVNPLMTVDEILDLDGMLYGLEQDVIAERKHMLLERFGLDKYRQHKPSALSGGYKQRLSIARALMHNPKLVILDEPTVGLDPHIRRQLWELIKQLKADGITIVLTTHYLDEAEALADRVVILDRGVIKLIDTPHNLTSVYQKKNLEDVFLQLMQEGAQQ